jgi:hypothetical protein
MFAQPRSPSATLAGMTATLGMGFNAAADDWTSGVDLTGLTATSKVQQLASGGLNSVNSIGSAGQTFGAIFSNTLTDQTLTIDVWGYTF